MNTGNKPDSNKYMGEVRIDDPYFYRRFESNPYHTNIQVASQISC